MRQRQPSQEGSIREGGGPPFFFAAPRRRFACRTSRGGLFRPDSVTDCRLEPAREPILNIPPAVVLLVVALGLVHALLTLVLSPRAATEFLLLFSFIPARFDNSLLPGGAFPGGVAADVWTFVSYALIHADLNHLFFNSVWLLAFGTAVARRFGAARFLAFFALTAAAGAAAHLATHPGDLLPVVGASAGISGAMAAAARFVFAAGGPLGIFRLSDADAYRLPAERLRDCLRDPRVMIFLGAWFGMNLLVGLAGIGAFDQSVAWQAHIGGFLAGLLAFPLFDPVSAPARPPADTAA